jgi:hypothetical protein
MRPIVLLALPLTLGLLACGDGKKVCTQAADQYERCVEKVLGAEMAKMARSKREAGIEACADDKDTIAMYRKCLPEKDCTKFLKCLEDYAAKH